MRHNRYRFVDGPDMLRNLIGKHPGAINAPLSSRAFLAPGPCDAEG
jgi:hypothetical protein